MNQAEVFQISNGLRVVHIRDPRRESVLVNLWGRLGRRAEGPDEVGCSHFLEHLLFDGTETRPDAKALDDFVNHFGAYRNGGTGPETVDYWIRVIKEHRAAAFEFVSDITQHSLLREEDIEKERKVIAQEIIRNRDDVRAAIARYSRSLVYPDQPAGYTIFDELDQLAEQSREKLVGFYKLYHTGNMVLGVVGDLSLNQARELAETYFASMPEGEPRAIPEAKILAGDALLLIEKEVDQVTFQINIPMVDPLSPAFFHYAVAGMVLHERLRERLREREHLAYNVRAAPAIDFDASYLGIFSAMAPENAPQGFASATEEIRRVPGTITEEEFVRAKNMLKSARVFKFEDPFKLLDRYCEDLIFYGELRSEEEQVRRIESVTLADAEQAAENISRADRKTVAIGRELREEIFGAG